MILRTLAALLLALPVGAGAVECGNRTFDGASYTVCEVDPATEDLRLFHRDDSGVNLGGFGALRDHVAPATVTFAMNAGMYHDDRSAVGLFIKDGAETMRLVTNPGPGNFGLLPNGVLCLGDGTASVWESLAFASAKPACRDATQSGPMLVVNGKLHPRFIDGGESIHIRNGVGVRADGTAVFAISNEPVNFHSFGRLFRDALDTPNALFLDGKVSRLYAPQIGRNDFGFSALGPIVAVISPAQ